MDEKILKVFENTRAQAAALKAEALERRKQRYRETEVAKMNAEIDKKAAKLIATIREIAEAKKATNLTAADDKALKEIEAEFGSTDEIIAKFLGGK